MDGTFTFHTDPGHGWLEVAEGDLTTAGLKVSDFSEYSYRRGSRLFLEEDLDAGVFINAWKAAGHSIRLVEENMDDEHWIRECRRINE